MPDEIHEPSHDRVYCVRCGGNWPCQPAPVLPSSGVDDDARTVAGYQALAEDPDYQAHQQLRRDSLALAWDRGRVAGLSEARDLVLGITTHAANPYKRGENDE